MLSTIQLDALTEVINIGIGKAGSVLSEIVGSPVRLRVPTVITCQLADLETRLELKNEESIVGISQSFSGSLSGDSVLLFPKDSGNSLTSEICHESEELADLSSERENTLLEVGNIVLNAVLGSLSNLFGQSLAFEMPTYREYTAKELVVQIGDGPEPKPGTGIIIFARANFDISRLHVTGNVLLVFEINSFGDLLKAIDSHVAEGIV